MSDEHVADTISETLPATVTVDELGVQAYDENQFEDSGVSIASNYWTPEEKGETKFCIFLGIDAREMADTRTGEMKSLDCVVLAEVKNGSLHEVINGSKRLVGIFERTGVQKSPYFIEYRGKKKSSTSGNDFDDWDVRLAKIKE